MNEQFLADVEKELSEVADAIDWKDEFYSFNSQIDALRNLSRKIGAQIELVRLRGKNA
jgi:hypothetical protein